MRTRVAILLLLTFSVACRTPGYGEFGILAPDYDAPSDGASIEVLAKDVTGKDCVPAYWILILRQPSYAKAVADALGKVAGANVMRSATFDYQDWFFQVCACVRGDAGRLQ